MKTRYRLIRRGNRGGAFYCVDTKTGKRTSLGTSNADEAQQIIQAKNKAERQPVLNLQIAKAYFVGSDYGITTRTWQHAMEALTDTKQDANQERWLRVVKDRAFDSLLPAGHHRDARRDCCSKRCNWEPCPPMFISGGCTTSAWT